MPKPMNTIGDRDYGRRMYASNKKYEEQRKLATNSHIDRIRRLEKHSEFKKPYLPDQSYPEMEGFNFDPYDPKWPGLPPGEPPTTGPVDPGGPVGPWKFDPKKTPPFLGCQFWPGIFNPDPIGPGEYSIGEVWIGSQDSVASIECHGPGHCDFSLAGCNQKSNISGRPGDESGPGVCQIVVWADENPDPRKGNGVVIQVTMASGMKCATTVDIKSCPPEIPIAWDFDTSAETIVRNGSAAVAVKNGTGPYTWAVSGTGFTLDNSKTYDKTNVLRAGSAACGSASITVTDICGGVATGEVRETTNGSWYEFDDPCACPIPGPSDAYTNPPPGWGMYYRTVGKYKCFEAHEQTYGSGPTTCEILGCSGRCYDLPYCHQTCGCGAKCITDSNSNPTDYTEEDPFCWQSVGGTMCVCRSSGSFCQEWRC